MEQFLENYIDELYRRQNIGAGFDQRDLFSKKDYYYILKPVLEVLKNNKDASLQELRDELYKRSGIEESIREYFLQKKCVSGAVFSFGTPLHQETVIVGNQEEVSIKDGKITPSISEMKEDTIFDLASVTKIFTSLCIMKLLDNGLINLSDEIKKYEPRFENLDGVTIYDLLCFNKPLRTSSRLDAYSKKEDAEEVLFNIVVNSENKNLTPYTDMGVMILKYVIEKVSGMNYYDYLYKTILEPLKMTNTHHLIPSGKLNRVASNNFDSKIINDGRIITNTTNIPGIVYDPKARILGQQNGELTGHAGLFSTASDMTTLLKKLISREVLDDKLLEEFGKNRQGRIYQDENGNDKYVQYLGYMTYSKHPILKYSEVFHALSGRSFAGAGWTGTQMTVDPINELYFFLGSNRAHNRVTGVDSEQKDKIVEVDGQKGIIMPDGSFKIDARDFAYKRDEVIVHPTMKLMLQYKMLEDMLNLSKQKDNEDKVIRKVN